MLITFLGCFERSGDFGLAQRYAIISSLVGFILGSYEKFSNDKILICLTLNTRESKHILKGILCLYYA